MLTYDLDLGAWVRKPGVETPAWGTVSVSCGQTASVPVQFCRGDSVQNLAGSTWFGGLKIENDFSGSYVASDSAPVEEGDGSIVFALDLSAVGYFATNPTESQVNAAFQICAVTDGVAMKTAPLRITLLNDYLTDQPGN